MQYSSFSVISVFRHKTVHPFRNFLAGPAFLQVTLYTVGTRKKFCINASKRVQRCLWGEERGWAYVNWKTLQKCKIVPRLLSMIVAFSGFNLLHKGSNAKLNKTLEKSSH